MGFRLKKKNLTKQNKPTPVVILLICWNPVQLCNGAPVPLLGAMPGCGSGVNSRQM